MIISSKPTPHVFLNNLQAKDTLSKSPPRLNPAADQVLVSEQNAAVAAPGIQDSDVVENLILNARQSILAQPATAMLAQANVMPQSALRLLP
jgi:flagellin-like hook-associated protein FlgL